MADTKSKNTWTHEYSREFPEDWGARPMVTKLRMERGPMGDALATITSEYSDGTEHSHQFHWDGYTHNVRMIRANFSTRAEYFNKFTIRNVKEFADAVRQFVDEWAEGLDDDYAN